MKLIFTGKNNLRSILCFSLYLSFGCRMVIAQAPVSSFTSNVSSGCVPLNVNFTNTSGQANSYFWNFGNGNTSTLLNPSAVYTTAGTFTISLIAINTLTNQRDTSTQQITVVPNPVAGFSATPLSTCSGSSTITFTNSSSNATQYTWDFGDGNSSNATNPTHLYTTAGIYTVKLIANNNYGCSDIQIKQGYITIRATPVAKFTSNLTSTCNVGTVFNFNCTTGGTLTYFWNLGDGTTSTVSNPSHTYAAPGSYTITLIVTDNFGCRDTLISPNYITIGASLVPSFTVNSTTGCVPFNCVFNCAVPNATSWLWSFGDGTTSTQQNPSHLYANPGNYTIALTVTTASGCNGTNTLTNYISVDPLPSAVFSTVQDSGCVPFNAQFTNSSTGSVSWMWDFGDATNSTLQNPSHVYNTAGNYTVTLHAYSANGCESVITTTNAVVTKKSTASFNASNNIGCPPLTTTFNSTASAGTIVSWQWTFGDGGTSTLQNPTHVYTTLGTYSVQLIVTNALGCTDTLLRYNYVKVVSGVTNYLVPDTLLLCEPGVINCIDPTFGSSIWSWNFGDGNTSTIKNPTHTYLNPGTYTITLQNNMPGGCAQVFNPYAIVKVFPVNLGPIQSISVSNCAPYTVSLANATPNVGTFNWNFGDGTTSNLQNPTHTYVNPGTYAITLTLLMQSGCSTSLSTIVTVGHSNPAAVNATQFCLGDPTQFSITNPAAFASYVWNFGDGTNSSQMNPTHTYASTGAYMVNVTTTDTSGCLQTFFLPSFVQVSNPLPSFTVTGPTTGCTNLNVVFNNTSTGSSSYLWDFGDGSTTTSTNPTHLYNTAGVYTVTLTASANGCTRTTTHVNQVIINAPVCNFMYTYTNGCLPVTATYTDLSPNAVAWAWNFGDGTTSTLQNPFHTFTSAPTSNVTLTIVDAFGCSKLKSKANINFLHANLKASDTLVCSKSSVAFTDLSNPGVSWQWNFGDGITSSQQNPSHTYVSPGIYTVSLIVTFQQGCSDTATFQNYIHVSAPQADFSSPAASGCSPTQINFNNLSTDATSYLWNFGDSMASSVISPSHIYSIPGYFTVTLVAYDNFGCTDTIQKSGYIKIPGTYSQFTLSGTSGCEQFIASFTDQSINANSWSWNFGDGNSSTIQNPVHQYTDTGNFIVTLITHDTLGCTSFYSFPTPVTIFPNPVAQATCIDTSGCQPHAANFSNSSTGATVYLWNFGDGDTSSLQNPVHTYLTPGLYVPFLVASNSNGCRDTFYLSQGVHNQPKPVSLFTSNLSGGCAPAVFTLTNQSSNISSPTYSWFSGNGNTSSLPNPSFTYPTPGNYNLSLVTINSNGCMDSSSITITVYDSPVANASTTDLMGCNPYTASFTNLSTNATSYLWDYGAGSPDTTANPSFTYLQSGVYPVSLVSYNSLGCSDTFHLPLPVIVNQSPAADFTVDHVAGCFGTPFGFTDQSIGVLNGASYNWYVGGNLTSNQQNPYITPVSSGLFDITLVIDNNNGCRDSVSKYPFIQVYDTIPPTVSGLKSVSVTSDTTVEITWAVSTAPDFAAYVLTRLDVPLNKFIPVFVDSNQNNGGIVVTYTYTDAGLNTLANVYTYRLETYDMCGNTQVAGKLTPHTTIDITAIPAGKNIQVSWTPYAGCPVDNYELSRMELPSGPWQLIGTVPANTLDFLDTSLSCPLNYVYRVNATNLCGENYSSLSDTSVAKPENELADQEVQIVRSTVFNNKSVLTEWQPPVLSPDRVVLYNIYRSTDSITYSFLASVPSQIQSYIDNAVEVNDQNYFYRVLAVNDCNLEGSQYTNSSSVLLKGNWGPQNTSLIWTKYRQWNTGVNQYVIEKLDENGQWQVIKVVDGTINSTSIDE